MISVFAAVLGIVGGVFLAISAWPPAYRAWKTGFDSPIPTATLLYTVFGLACFYLSLYLGRGLGLVETLVCVTTLTPWVVMSVFRWNSWCLGVEGKWRL